MPRTNAVIRAVYLTSRTTRRRNIIVIAETTTMMKKNESHASAVRITQGMFRNPLPNSSVTSRPSLLEYVIEWIASRARGLFTAFRAVHGPEPRIIGTIGSCQTQHSYFPVCFCMASLRN